MLTTYTFPEVVMGGFRVQYTCRCCGKKRTRTVKRTYYRNGFHNETETRAQFAIEIEKERFMLYEGRGVCTVCFDNGERENWRKEEVPEGWKPEPKPVRPRSWKTPRRYLCPSLKEGGVFRCRTQEEFDRVFPNGLVDPRTGEPVIEIPWHDAATDLIGIDLVKAVPA